MKNYNLKGIGVRIPKSVRDKFTAKATSEGHSGASIIKEFIYDFIGTNPTNDRQSKEPRYVKINLSPDTYDKLNTVCKEKGITKAHLLNELMRRYIQDNE